MLSAEPAVLDEAPASGSSIEAAPGEDAAGLITDPRLQQLHAYWRRKAAGRPMPRRADIDPSDIPRLLPHIMLVDVLPAGRYRYRLIGTANAEAHGLNATGRYIDEVLPGPEYRGHVIGLYDECVRSRRPVYSEALFLSPGRQATERHTKVLFLPLAEDGATVNMVLVMQVFFYVDRSMRSRHFLEAQPHREIVHAALPDALAAAASPAAIAAVQ